MGRAALFSIEMYRGPLGQPDTVRAQQCQTPDTRRILRGRYASVSDSVQCVSAARGRAVSDAFRASDTVRVRTVSGCLNGHGENGSDDLG